MYNKYMQKHSYTKWNDKVFETKANNLNQRYMDVPYIIFASFLQV